MFADAHLEAVDVFADYAAQLTQFHFKLFVMICIVTLLPVLQSEWWIDNVTKASTSIPVSLERY